MKIDSQKILYDAGNYKDSDLKFTPDYGVNPILKYVALHTLMKNEELIVWCPFDTDKSQFVKQISQLDNVQVVHSHIDEGKNFYDYEPEKWNILVSNPPFTNKRFIFERALSFNKPFALLMSLTWLNDSAPKKLFMEKELQLLMFDKRIKFIDGNGDIDERITFSTAYYCYDFLPKQIIMERLNVPKKQKKKTK